MGLDSVEIILAVEKEFALENPDVVPVLRNRPLPPCIMPPMQADPT